MHKIPKLSVVGAGPGDPELITRKGINALQKADVVLYDALINKELLDYAPQAELIYVGKRKGNHRYSQDQINRLIVKKALSEGHVIRLKGGDPFVFGRGAEELEFAQSYGLETEVVSGISASIAVSASVGIPLTKRSIAQSFWVITGTTSEGQLAEDIRLAAQSSATVVILMGMGKIKQIVKIFTQNGKGKTPVGIIQNGTTNREKTGFGTIQNIEKIIAEKELGTPAIIVIGEVVRERQQLQALFEHVEQVEK